MRLVKRVMQGPLGPYFHTLHAAADLVLHAHVRDREHQISMNAHLTIVRSFLPFALIPFLPYYPVRIIDWFWRGGAILDILMHSWPLFVFSTIDTTLKAWRTRHSLAHRVAAPSVYRLSIKTNRRAGIGEEFIFRFAYIAILVPLLFLINFILAGFLPTFEGALVWAYENVLIGTVNFWTGYLIVDFIDAQHWAMILAMVLSNYIFMKGHAYQGMVGLLHSWAIGWGFFFLTMTYGLVIAMAVHFVHNMLIETIIHFDTHWDTRHHPKGA